MKNVLMLTSRDIYNDGGEKTLMECKRLWLMEYGYNLKYFSFRNDALDSAPILKDGTVAAKYPRWAVLFPFIWMSRLSRLIKEDRIEWLVVSGPILYALFPVLVVFKKLYKLRISLDYQGCLEELVEYNHVGGKAFIRHIVFRVFKALEGIFIRTSVDLIEVVSENCKVYIRDSYGYNGEFALIPCGVNEIYDAEKYKYLREKWQNRLKVKKDVINLVYSGGLSPWQNVDLIIDYCRRRPDVNIYIFTGVAHHDHLNSLGLNNLTVDNLPTSDMVEALCAFDGGFLLRDENTTNFVAFPNKYSEYVNARLKVIVLSHAIGCLDANQTSARDVTIELEKALADISSFKIKVEAEYLRELNNIHYAETVKTLIKSYELALI